VRGEAPLQPEEMRFLKITRLERVRVRQAFRLYEKIDFIFIDAPSQSVII
jgi:hypothetical protein